MPSGGARARSGPAPDPDALRRNRPSDSATWVRIPAEGRQGDPPTWPLTKASARELQLWAEEWTRPQAVMWEQNHQEREVAFYVRAMKNAEMPKAPTVAQTLVRQFMEGLGVSADGLRRNRWIIDHEPAEQGPVRADDTDRASAKSRLRSIAGGAAS